MTPIRLRCPVSIPIVAVTLMLCLDTVFIAAAADTPEQSEAGSWAFNPVPYTEDPGPDAVFDTRPLFDKVAGEKGWIRVGPNGGFVRGDGSTIRFWAASTKGHERKLDEFEAHISFMARRGMNLIRHHGLIPPPTGKPVTEINEATLDNIHKTIAVAKRHGVYTIVKAYWAVTMQASDQHPIYGRTKGPAFGLLFWDKEMQDIFKGWIREMLTRPNPYDPNKTPLKDDPAFAIFQPQHEDSLFFWTQQEIHKRPEEFAALSKIFKVWLAKNNLPAEAELDFKFWLLNDQTQTPPLNTRLTMRFAAEAMHAFNEDIQHFVHDELKCPVLIQANNWQTANQTRLLDLERWSYTSNDLVGVNRYFMGQHTNPTLPAASGFAIKEGDLYTDISCVREGWRASPLHFKQIPGKPTVISESNWVSPNAYQSEAPFLVAVYQALTGIDVYCWYQVLDGGFDAKLYKWQSSTPTNLGGWPAATWMYHKGYVKKGDVVVDEYRAFEGDMWELRCPVISEDGSFDPNRPGTQTTHSEIKGGVPYGAFRMGPVLVHYGDDPKKTKIDLHGQKPEDLARGVVESTTKEIKFDAVNGCCRLDAPKAQGVTGFLKSAGPIELSALSVNANNEYATVLAVCLDDLPLAESGKIFVQITTRCRPSGWKDEMTDYKGKPALEITSLGKMPWMVENTDMTLSFLNGKISKAMLLDNNFKPLREVRIPVKRSGTRLMVVPPSNAMYILIE